jgi:hypothetical protein
MGLIEDRDSANKILNELVVQKNKATRLLSELGSCHTRIGELRALAAAIPAQFSAGELTAIDTIVTSIETATQNKFP